MVRGPARRTPAEALLVLEKDRERRMLRKRQSRLQKKAYVDARAEDVDADEQTLPSIAVTAAVKSDRHPVGLHSIYYTPRIGNMAGRAVHRE
jgi:hypothetical protein